MPPRHPPPDARADAVAVAKACREVSSRYVQRSKIGEGSFGEVWRAVDAATGDAVALKRVAAGDKVETRIRALHELECLLALRDSKHVVYLREAFLEDGCLVLVLDLYPRNLLLLIQDLTVDISEAEIKRIVRSLLFALRDMRARNIMHRDIKPANVLMSGDGSRVVLADFGLAIQQCFHEYSHQVMSRWYRAPELLYGSRHYDAAVDMWAVGCIFVELFHRRPLFRGESDIDQLRLVLQTCGVPSEHTWPGVSTLPDFGKIYFQDCPPRPWRSVLSPRIPDLAADLIGMMLVLCPSGRIAPEDAIVHPFFWTEPVPHFAD